MSNVEESFSEALMFHRTGITSKAICYYEKVLEIDPSHEISQHHLSILEFGLGNYEKALNLQNNLININPHKAGFYNNRGNTLLRLGDVQKAISDFNHAIEIDPHKAEFLVNRANALSCLDEFPEALFDLDKAIKVDVNLAIAYANRANVHSSSKHFHDALIDIDHALELEPHNAQFHFNKGNILVSLHRHQEAVINYQISCDIDSNFEIAHLKLAHLVISLQSFPEAVRVLNKMLNHFPQSLEYLILLGEVHAQLGNTEEAQIYFTQAKNLSPHNEEVDYYAAANLGLAAPSKSPPAYIKRLFDAYAHNFDKELQQDLRYASPDHLKTQLVRHISKPIVTALDLGCGTGLVAKSLRSCFEFIDGVDISSEMIKKSESTKLYRQLHLTDIHSFLLDNKECYDLVMCADTLVYIGKLDEVFQGVSQILNIGGWFSFTVEATALPTFQLKQSKRYGHSISYLQHQAQQSQLDVVAIEGDVIRRENSESIHGLNVLLRKNK